MINADLGRVSGPVIHHCCSMAKNTYFVVSEQPHLLGTRRETI